jgi:ethanolamine ammonia-lyase small subunit
MPEAPPVPTIPPPPMRVFPVEHHRSGLADKAAKHTTALVGIGHVGTRYATDVVLQFQAELAVAHEAVATELPDDWAEKQGLLALQSRVGSHREFLLRPDLGRRLSDESLARLEVDAVRGIDVQLILADGLSAVACMGSGIELMDHMARECEALGLRVGTKVCAKFARVWLEDEIGQQTQAKVAAILLGERPGLGTGDGLSAYMVYEPRVGKTDGDRNMMSNIHQRGTTPEQAARRLALLAATMIEQGTSGVDLDLSQLADIGLKGGYRAPQVREKLVEKA